MASISKLKNIPYGFFQSFSKNLPRYSCRELESLHKEITASPDYDGHEAIFFSTHCDDVYLAFIHNTNRGLGHGGARLRRYDTVDELMNDGLRLSKGMSYKNALADLNWGGGKAIIHTNKKTDKGLKNFAKFISRLDGCYYTAEDLNLGTRDMDLIHNHTRYVTCVSRGIGGSGNPSRYTANGVVSALDQVIEYRGMDYQDLVIGIEGIGNVGSQILKYVIERRPRKIFIQDTDQDKLDIYKYRYSGLFGIEVSENVIEEDIDVYMPCALGSTLNPQTIPHLKDTIICGAANNQLQDDSCAELLHRINADYIPDYLVNRMGIVNCANELNGYLEDDELINRHFDPGYPHSIPANVKRILSRDCTDNLSSIRKLSTEMLGFSLPNSRRAKLIMEQICQKMIRGTF